MSRSVRQEALQWLADRTEDQLFNFRLPEVSSFVQDQLANGEAFQDPESIEPPLRRSALSESEEMELHVLIWDLVARRIVTPVFSLARANLSCFHVPRAKIADLQRIAEEEQ